MLIRSQDKRAIVNLDDITEIYTNIVNPNKEIKEKYKTEIKYHGGTLNNRYLGTYSSEEKAIKVLDMIQEAYARCESARTLTTGTVFEIARESKTQDVVEEIKKGHRDNFVFQMPQDSEVYHE